MRKRFLLAAAAALVAATSLLTLATPALAVRATVRVQGLEHEICPPTTVDVTDNLVVTDSAANVIDCDTPTALGALYLAAQERSFEFVTASSSGGVFLDSLAGSGGSSNGGSSWWMYAVNGCTPWLGLADLNLEPDDEILLYEVSGDSPAPWNNKALVLQEPTTCLAGQATTFTVRGDDLGKPNNAADAVRFGLGSDAEVESPEAFAPVAGAVLHVGPDTFESGSDGQVSIPAVPVGTYAVWLEKAFDTDFNYIAGPGGFELTGMFLDVDAGHPYFTAIHALAAAGVVAGYKTEEEQTTPSFGPDSPLFRAQFAKMIVGALGLPVVEADFPDPNVPFIDLGEDDDPADLYPHEYVAVCARHDITHGSTATNFSPWDSIKRFQVISMVVRAVDEIQPGLLAPIPDDFDPSWDPAISEDHGRNAARAEYNDLLVGISGLEDLDPWGAMSRGETAQILYNLLQKLQ